MSSPDESLTRQSRICLALMRVGTRMASRFDMQFANHGVTQAQFRALLGVWQLAGQGISVTPSLLADYLFIERPTVTVLVAKLVERGLVQRIENAFDRRSHGLCLTPAGGDILRAAGPVATSLGAETLALFDDTEQEAFLQWMQRLEAFLRDGGVPPLDANEQE